MVVDTETPDVQPLTFADVQDEEGNDLLVARDVLALTAAAALGNRASRPDQGL